MDQDAFRQTYHEVNERYCVYEKSILTNQCQCSRVEKFCIAEREGAHCTLDQAQQLCAGYLDVLREQAKFALKTTEGKSALPHGKAIRIQVGGLRGLYVQLNPDQVIPSIIPDVHQLISQAMAIYGSLDDLPFPGIMQEIAAYKGRSKSRGRRR